MNNRNIKDTLFVITARGGSKGIPRKNIKPLGGKPLIVYSIEMARRFVPDEYVIVSTEDEEIADISRSTGLPVEYMRPMSLAGDTVGSREVILDVMDWADRKGLKYDKVCLLQPTSPLRSEEDVQACLDMYTPDVDMVTTVVEAAANPYYDCFEPDPENGFMRISKGHGLYTRRQDAPQVVQTSGSVYVFNPTALREKRLGDMDRRRPCLVDSCRSVDLDTPLDWAIAETVLRLSRKADK
ncbi:MAG: acylneuraminate cytidylyltransferase family protein [Bacteroides sp.]|nr:acylneuraminate cytidylyltransferase family protein [Bacteroides sp.]MCM1414133.1 acylneuraminate cytidylyltransferase family protein [Bacteroides sp.]MCM1470999.1 acylneuraminate cytidylyltransferase family protein [Bacteroides sp.]